MNLVTMLDWKQLTLNMRMQYFLFDLALFPFLFLLSRKVKHEIDLLSAIDEMRC